jgi:hypothetical protein
LAIDYPQASTVGFESRTMTDTRKWHLFGLGLTAVLMVGCNSVNEPSKLNSASENSLKAKDSAPPDGSQIAKPCIQPGFGIPECHVGMPISELDPTWEKTEEYPNQKVRNMGNKAKGIECSVKDDRVWHVFFHARPQGEFSANKYKIAERAAEIGSEHEARAIYGDPTYILATDYKEQHEVSLHYAELGMQFRFVNGVLDTIVISAPDPNVDIEAVKRIFGDTVVYVRPAGEGQHGNDGKDNR